MIHVYDENGKVIGYDFSKNELEAMKLQSEFITNDTIGLIQ